MMARGLVAYEFMRTYVRTFVTYFQGNGQCRITNIDSVLTAPPFERGRQ
jgi:hypothetical protein